MNKIEIIENLQKYRDSLRGEIVNAFRERGATFGNERFNSWKNRLTKFLDKSLPGESSRLNAKLTHLVFSIRRGESDLDIFWRDYGELSDSFLDSLIMDIQSGEYEFVTTETRPEITQPSNSNLIDIKTHVFDVAFSFPGEVRSKVKDVVDILDRAIGTNSSFYDYKYQSQLARPSLDVMLQDIYRNRSRLIVVFICSDYQRKDWCGIEFNAIREIIMNREHDRIMYVRMDDGKVDGVFKIDGYIDGEKFGSDKIATFIQERIALQRVGVISEA